MAAHDQNLRPVKPNIVVFGVGGGGGNAVNNMIAAGLRGVEFVSANTDAQALAASKADRLIQLGVHVTEGLGAGAQPEVGRAAAEECIDEIVEHLSGANMVFVTAGMGGGTGTGAAPVVAGIARDRGILTVGVVTRPFAFEGSRRARLADQGIEELQRHVDTLIIIPNQNLFRIANEKTTFADAFRMADEVLYSGVACITELMVKEGLINLDFADVRSVMRGMGKAMMGTGQASGAERARQAADQAISNPLFDIQSIRGAKGVLISISGGHDLTLFEVDEAATRIREYVSEDANIILGATVDDALEGTMRVSVVATGVESTAVEPVLQPLPQAVPESFRPAGRIVSPPTASPSAVAPPKPAPAAAPVEDRGPMGLLKRFTTRLQVRDEDRQIPPVSPAIPAVPAAQDPWAPAADKETNEVPSFLRRQPDGKPEPRQPFEPAPAAPEAEELWGLDDSQPFEPVSRPASDSSTPRTSWAPVADGEADNPFGFAAHQPVGPPRAFNPFEPPTATGLGIEEMARLRREIPPARAELVDLSVFSRPVVQRRARALVQVFLHLPGEDATPVAREADQNTERRARKSLALPLALDDVLTIVISATECEIDEPQETIVWRGAMESASFWVKGPQDLVISEAAITVRAFRNGEPLGKIGFTLQIVDEFAPVDTQPKIMADDVRLHRNMFISYSSKDRDAVIRYTHAWSLLKHNVFQDILSLRAGEDWEDRLHAEIDQCDLFLLFWSEAAKNSEHVLKETERALARLQRGDAIEILPVVIEGPPAPTPPPSLSRIHFNDRFSYLISSVMTEKRNAQA